ncbi:unnamed protein product [Mycena citricolor]|uniref:Uncharacterized protein n=1 Tax=Mycena citricolor TaxID=2018698 RepID=A0AAD2K0L0_9AGAR|nr:unnamed protein product [Mycena citricolor]
MFDQIQDFGPFYSFWAFLTERLNKTLKNLNSNNWTGGRLEVSMMREFQRGVQLETAMKRSIQSTDSALEEEFIQILLGNMTTGPLGTIQDASQAASTKVRAGPVRKSAQAVDSGLKQALLRLYNKEQPQVHLGAHDMEGTETLHTFIQTYQHAFLSGRKIIPSSLHGRPTGSSLIQVYFDNVPHAGEVLYLFSHWQPGVNTKHDMLYAAVRWMVPSKYSPLDNTGLWDHFPELGVETWELGAFVNPTDNFPPAIIPMSDIHCQVARRIAQHTDPPMWITTTIDRVCDTQLLSALIDTL